MGSKYEELVGVVLTAAEEWEGSFSLEELAAKLNLSKGKRTEQIKSAVDGLCDMGILIQQGDRWIYASHLQETAASRSELLVSPPLHPMSPETSPLALCTNASQVTSASSYASNVVSYVCDGTAVIENKRKLKRILDVLHSSPTPLKAAHIASKSELGKSKGDVNRYLYFLEKRGVVIHSGNEWRLNQSTTDLEDPALDVYAAELAKVPPSKRQQSKPGQSSACEYGCQPRSGNCYHVKQENHYHQTNIQIGDNSKIEFRSNDKENLKM